MYSFLFLILGMVAVLSTQIYSAFYRYLLSKSHFSEAIRIESMFNSTGRNILRYMLILVGLGLFFLSGYCCLNEMPEHFPLLLSFIFGFIFWILLLQLSFKIILNVNHSITATSIVLAFSIPLVLIGLILVTAYLFPNVHPIMQSYPHIN